MPVGQCSCVCHFAFLPTYLVTTCAVKNYAVAASTIIVRLTSTNYLPCKLVYKSPKMSIDTNPKETYHLNEGSQAYM